MKKILALILFFYILTLIQTSFLAHFSIFGITPNIIIIALIILIFFEKKPKNLSIPAAFIGGLFLDIFSANFFGFWILILLAISFFIKFILSKYVRISLLQRV